jgi:hypothetical protein
VFPPGKEPFGGGKLRANRSIGIIRTIGPGGGAGPEKPPAIAGLSRRATSFRVRAKVAAAYCLPALPKGDLSTKTVAFPATFSAQ